MKIHVDQKYYHTWFSSIEKVRMVAALPQLHEYVEQLHLGHLPSSVHNVNVLQKDLSVPVECVCTQL